MRRACLFFFLVTVLGLSCSKSKIPASILQPEKMQAVYWDYIRADVYTNEMIRNDSTKIAARENSRLQNEIFAFHKITKEDFYESYDYYLNHPLMLKEMLDTMTVRQQKKIEIQKAIDIKKDSLRMRILKKNADTLKIK